MNKKKAILFMIFGAVLLITLQNTFLKPTFAKSDNLISESQVSKNQNTVNFENAAERLEDVVDLPIPPLP